MIARHDDALRGTTQSRRCDKRVNTLCDTLTHMSGNLSNASALVCLHIDQKVFSS